MSHRRNNFGEYDKLCRKISAVPYHLFSFESPQNSATLHDELLQQKIFIIYFFDVAQFYNTTELRKW